MLVPYARKNHNVSNFNPFHDFDELERAFFSDNALGEFKTDIQEDGDNFVLEAGTSFCFGSVTRRTPSAYAALMPVASMPEISKLLA